MKLQHQIGGHPNVTSDESGTLVIKPASPREIAFYQLLHSTPAPPRTSVVTPASVDKGGGDAALIRREVLLGHLKRFLPRFYGTLKVQSPIPELDDGQAASMKEPSLVDSSECIILSNLTVPFLRPSIMDIKLGTVLYDADDPATTEEKARKMEAKMKVRSSMSTGAAITGFQTWNANEEKFESGDRDHCRTLKPEELAPAFVQFVPVPVDVGATPRTTTLRTLHALSSTLSSFAALLSHLEIRLIGASLLIIYEGDPSRLRQAWELVDSGTSRGDGLDDDLLVEDDLSDIEGEEGDQSSGGGAGKGSLFSHVFGRFGAERNDGSQGFGLLDGSPPPSPKRARPNRSVLESQTEEPSDHDADMEPDDDEERFADEDAQDRIPRPFTLRLIDFAHTRLADGEGPDQGALKGVRTVIDLVQGRIRELEGSSVGGESTSA